MDQDSLLVSDNLLPQSEVPQKTDSISRLPDHYLAKIDSLVQAKAQLLQARINNLHAKAAGKFLSLDSISSISVDNFLNNKLKDLSPEQYTAKLDGINKSLDQYKSNITDSEELAWVEHYSGQLDQLEGVVKQYQDMLLNLEELQALKGYSQQLKQLSQESRSCFQEDKISPYKRLIVIKFAFI